MKILGSWSKKKKVFKCSRIGWLTNCMQKENFSNWWHDDLTIANSERFIVKLCSQINASEYFRENRGIMQLSETAYACTCKVHF